jgi:antitoxin component HigA of HigAB toxin-antitoxin module
VADPNLKIKIEASDETRAAFEAVKRSMETTGATAAKMGAEVQKAQGGMRSFGGIAQQAGYQIGDFASQVASGGSAVTAFVQQGSQLLGMFGMFGAIAGAGLAIAGVAYQMLSAKDAAKETRDAFDDLNDEIERLNKATAERTAPTARLSAGLEAARLREEIFKLQSAAQIQTGSGGMMGDLGVGLEASAVGAARATERIKELEKQLEALTKAENANRIAVTLSDDAYNYTLGTGDLLVAQRRERERAEKDAADAAVRAAEQRAREAERFNEAAERSMQQIRAEQDRYNQSLDQQAQRLREQLDPNVAYAAELERIGELYRTNRISVEEYAAADEAARNRIFRQTERVDDATRQLGFTFQSAFEDAIVKGEKMRNVLAGIAQDIARIVLRQTVTTRLAGFITSGIGGLLGGSAAPAALGPVDLGLPGFADGGPVGGGRPIVVGEEGPEVFVPHSAGQIIPNGESMGGTVVHQTINISVGVAQTVRAEIAALMPAIKRQTVDAVADARMRGGSFAAAMGT